MPVAGIRLTMLPSLAGPYPSVVEAAMASVGVAVGILFVLGA